MIPIAMEPLLQNLLLNIWSQRGKIHTGHGRLIVRSLYIVSKNLRLGDFNRRYVNSSASISYPIPESYLLAGWQRMGLRHGGFFSLLFATLLYLTCLPIIC